MSHLSTQGFASVLDHLSDVIEGGNAYASGTSFRGVPGTHSNDEGLRTGGEGTFVASGTPTTTTCQRPSGSWLESRWVKDDTPGFFLVDDVQSAARRITAWDNGTKTYTTDAFPAAPAAGRTMTVRQGFKRHPNHADIEAEETGASGGYDRTFALELNPGNDLGLYGSGRVTHTGELAVRLRLLKYSRIRDIRQSAAENIFLITQALRMGGVAGTPNHRDGTYIRAILPAAAPPEYDETPDRVVVTATLPVVYTISINFE